MSLEQQVMAEIKTAMLARDEKGLRGLRAIKAAIIIAKTSEGAGGEIKQEEEMKSRWPLRATLGGDCVSLGSVPAL